MEIRQATPDDTPVIALILRSNSDEHSLYQRVDRDIRSNINDFLVTESNGRIVACAALHRHDDRFVEIQSVSVLKHCQNAGIGRGLINECIQIASSEKADTLWLSTAQPSYFAQFGFTPISKFSIPFSVLMSKLKLVFQQPMSRWLPSIAGRYTFMGYIGFAFSNDQCN